jgi:bifunctional non-homologous end joining protein LigD
LKFVGHSGSGFKDKVMKEVIDKLKPLETNKKPFVNEVDHSTTPHWIKPQLVGNFKFATWTASGKIRKPAIFLGFRDDKDPKDVVFEVPLSTQEETKVVTTQDEAPAAKPKGRKTKAAVPRKPVLVSTDSNWRELDKIPITSREVFTIESKEVELTNIEREVWDGIPKADLIQYYHKAAPFILPYLQSRPLSLHIKHIKATASGLYIKDMEGRQPSWAEVFTVKRKHKKKEKRDVIDYLVCSDEATLLYAVNLGCVDINPWTSTTADYLHPSFVIIDLDPSDNDFNKAIETAIAAKEYFDQHKIKAFPKTSGKTGIHLYLPCEGFTFPQARKIAERICKDIHEMVPDITTTNISVNSRGNKLYVDPNQNDEADTVAAPYSVRPFHHPSVSTPLEWKEVKAGLDPLSFDISTIFKRIDKKGDLFAGVIDKKIASQNSSKLSALS